MIFGWSILGFMQGAPVYYAEHIMGNSNLVGIINAFFTAPLILGFIMVPMITKKIGRKKMLTAGLILVTIGRLIMVNNSSSFLIVYLSYFLISIRFVLIC